MLQRISIHWIRTVTENFILDINNKYEYKWSQTNHQKGTLHLQPRRREDDPNRLISLYFPESSLVKAVLSAFLQIFRSWGEWGFSNSISFTVITSQEHNFNALALPTPTSFSQRRGEKSQDYNLNFSRIYSIKFF